ncbi:MAG: protein jag [Spirochaetes bacterium]|jgi:spoIIIJ-associated protein|nr:protein jag [Spirochaetota bacterium]
MKVIEIEGKSLDDAKKKAAEELGIEVSALNKKRIEVLDEGKSGIFGFGVSRPARIQVSYDVLTKDIGEYVKDIIHSIFKKMGLDISIVEFHEGESKVYVELESSNSGLIIGKKGKTLEAVQFLVNLIVNQQNNSDKKIILDIEGYRAKRERSLKSLARTIAAKVARNGKAFTMEPMNPFERRLIHLTLQNDNRVTTRSEGQGIYRKVKVFPKRNG